MLKLIFQLITLALIGVLIVVPAGLLYLAAGILFLMALAVAAVASGLVCLAGVASEIMTNVIHLRKEGHDIERLWAAYVTAMSRAQQSLKLDDGIAAGRAWKAFIEAFEDHE